MQVHKTGNKILLPFHTLHLLRQDNLAKIFLQRGLNWMHLGESCGLQVVWPHLMERWLHLTHESHWLDAIHGFSHQDAPLSGHAVATPRLDFIPYIWLVHIC